LRGDCWLKALESPQVIPKRPKRINDPLMVICGLRPHHTHDPQCVENNDGGAPPDATP
jgi:hypothetical protein